VQSLRSRRDCVLLPVPGVDGFGFQSVRGAPNQHGVRPCGVSVATRHITSASRCYFVGHRFTIGQLKSPHHVEYAIANPCAQVDDQALGVYFFGLRAPLKMNYCEPKIGRCTSSVLINLPDVDWLKTQHDGLAHDVQQHHDPLLTISHLINGLQSDKRTVGNLYGFA